MIWAIILAAGESKRMGRPKLLLPFGNKTIIETIVSNAIESKADEVLVILGSGAENIEEKIRDFPAKTSVNPNFRQGMLSSIQWGFEILPEDTRAALVMLGDQPMVSSSVIDKVIDAYEQTEKSIVLPIYNKRRGCKANYNPKENRYKNLNIQRLSQPPFHFIFVVHDNILAAFFKRCQYPLNFLNS